MAAPRRIIEISIGDEELVLLGRIARSRTEPACRVARARMLLAYRTDPSTHAVGEAIGVTHQTVLRCLDRAVRFGAMAALEDSPRPGKAAAITDEARAWLVSLACRKAKELGYPHELWTTRLLARHVRAHAAAAGHRCLGNIVQGTVCKILARHEVKPHKVRYYLERRDEAFETKMAGIDLLTGHVHACVEERHRSREFIGLLKRLDEAYPADTAIKLILDNHSAHISKETSAWIAAQPQGRFSFVFTPKHGSWLNLVEGFFSKMARSMLRHIRVASKAELKARILAYLDDLNRDPVIHTWTYKIAEAA